MLQLLCPLKACVMLIYYFSSAKDKSVLEAAYHANPKPDKAARLEIVNRVSLNEKEVQVSPGMGNMLWRKNQMLIRVADMVSEQEAERPPQVASPIATRDSRSQIRRHADSVLGSRCSL